MGGRGTSFVGDVTWIAEGDKINGIVHGLEACAQGSLAWAQDNAVRFETCGTEAMPFSLNRYTVPPASTRSLQLAIIQGTLLYASEIA